MKELLGLPVLASEHGAQVDNLIIYVHWLMIVLFVGWLSYFAYALFRFHRSRNPRADYVGVKNHASNYIEGAVVIVEAVLLIGVAVPLWTKAVDKFPARNEATVIHVVGQDTKLKGMFSNSPRLRSHECAPSRPLNLVVRLRRTLDGDLNQMYGLLCHVSSFRLTVAGMPLERPCGARRHRPSAPARR